MEKNPLYQFSKLIVGIGQHLKMSIDRKLSHKNLTMAQFKVIAYP